MSEVRDSTTTFSLLNLSLSSQSIRVKAIDITSQFRLLHLSEEAATGTWNLTTTSKRTNASVSE